MKNWLISLILIMSLLVSFTACGEYNPPEDQDTGNTESDTSTDNTEEGEGGSQDNTGTPFTATVMLGGKPFVPADTGDSTSLKVRWTDGKSYKTVNVGEDGRATCYGLDGDYTVTLINLPEGYTYNPNIYTASSDRPNVTVELYRIASCRGAGTELYNCKLIDRMSDNPSFFRATVEKANQVVYFEFTPVRAGTYVIESHMDVSAQMYNPIADVYIGSSAWKGYDKKLDDGGVSSGYTKNFKNTVQVGEEFIGNSYTFGVWVEGKDAVYPVNVDFSITYTGTYIFDGYVNSSIIIPKFITKGFDKTAYASYLASNRSLFGDSQYKEAYVSVSGMKVFDQSIVKYNEADGYYHIYNSEKYASTGGYGPILYANITIPTSVISTASFSTIEYSGNKNLTVNGGTENYKLFIEGYAQLVNDTVNYFCLGDCPCRKTNGGCCPIEDNCQKCTKDCRHISKIYIGQLGYADIAIEGRCPVTAELKDFLQKFSMSQRLFSDGLGIGEDCGYDSYEDSQWLFACGYYSD